MTTLQVFFSLSRHNKLRSKLRNLQLSVFCREALSLVNVTRSDCVNYQGLQDESHDLGYSYPILHAILAERVHVVDDYATVVYGYGTDAVLSCRASSSQTTSQIKPVQIRPFKPDSHFSAVGMKQTLIDQTGSKPQSSAAHTT